MFPFLAFLTPKLSGPLDSYNLLLLEKAISSANCGPQCSNGLDNELSLMPFYKSSKLVERPPFQSMFC